MASTASAAHRGTAAPLPAYLLRGGTPYHPTPSLGDVRLPYLHTRAVGGVRCGNGVLRYQGSDNVLLYRMSGPEIAYSGTEIAYCGTEIAYS
eukprot:574622-Rhodomonas_salina.1